MATSEAFEMEQRGELIIGGCTLWEDAPTRGCLECKHEWIEPSDLEDDA